MAVNDSGGGGDGSQTKSAPAMINVSVHSIHVNLQKRHAKKNNNFTTLNFFYANL